MFTSFMFATGLLSRDGFFNGTLMISMRMSDEEASLSGVSLTQPGSSLGDLIPADPET